MAATGSLLGAVSLSPVALAAPATIYVSGSGSDAAGCGTSSGSPCLTISYAVSLANAGDTISIAAGTYAEQLTLDKSLTLTGAGTGTTIIQAPATLATDGWNQKDVVDLDGGANVTISDLTVEGPGPGGCDSIDYGIFVGGGATLTLQSATVADIRDTPLSGCQSGIGVGVGGGSNNQVGHATITGVTVSGYQKNGIVVDSAGSTATVAGDTITGAGATTALAQNGIQVSRGATATITGNTVTGDQYTGTLNKTDPQADYAAGILLYGAGQTTVAGNTLTDDQIGVESVASDATIGGTAAGDGNTISETGSGIADSIGIYAVPCDIYCSYLNITGGSDTLAVEGNRISGIPATGSAAYTHDSSPAVVSEGVWVGNTPATGSVMATVSGNTVSGGFQGIEFGPDVQGTIANNQVSGFEKNGITAGGFSLGGGGVRADISGNTVTGAGAGNTDVWAQNGIEISNGATGSVTGNQLSGFVYTGTQDTEATGILVFESSGVAVSGNTVTDSQAGIALQSAGYSTDSNNWVMTGETVSGNTIQYDASYQAPGKTAGADATWGVWVAAYNDAASVSASVYGNALDGSGASPGDSGIPSVGLQVGDTATGGAKGSVDVTAHGNAITGWQTGVLDAGAPNVTGALDATDNWWGSKSGPTGSVNTYNVGSQGDAVSGAVTVAPWLTGPPALGATGGADFAPVTDVTSGTGFASIQAAVDAASPGDTIDVAAGTFTQGVTVNKSLTLLGAQHGVDARTRSGPESLVSSLDITSGNVTVDGFSFNGTGNGGQVPVQSPTILSGVVVENNIFSDYGSVALPTYDAGNILIQQNLFDSPKGTGESIQIKASSVPGGCNGSQVLDNVFDAATNNGAADVNFSCTGSSSSNVTISGNKTTGNSDQSSFAAFSGVAGGIHVTQNTGTTSGSSVFFFGSVSGSVQIEDNTFTGGDGSAVSIHGADITSDTANTGTFTIANNDFSGNAGGIAIAPRALGSGAQVVAHDNDLSGDGANGFQDASPVAVDAADNWWGCAGGPGAAGCATVSGATYAPWLASVQLTPATLSVGPGQTATETATLTDSSGSAVQDSGLSVAFGTSGTSGCTPAGATLPLDAATGSATFSCQTQQAGSLGVTATALFAGQPSSLSGTAGATVALPQVTGLDPASGPTSGGTTVTVSGSGFTGATAVRFGGVPAPSFSVAGDGRLTAVSPAGSAGTVDVTVTTPNGTSLPSAGDGFTYTSGTPAGQPPQQTLTLRLAPATVATGANASVSATVYNSYGAPLALTPIGLDVTAGNLVPATVTTDVYGSFSGTFTAPATPGAVTVTASVYGASGQAIILVAAPDTVSGSGSASTTSPITPATAQTQGTSATASGGTGTVNVADYTVNPTGTAVFGNPAGATYFDVSLSAGSTFQSLTIRQCGLTSGEFVQWYDAKTDAWQDVNPPATVDASGCATIGPLNATTSSPTLSDLQGTPFAAVPASAGGGGGGGFATATGLPVVSGISPASGPAGGGTTVTITGSNLSGATAVDFGSSAAAGVSVLSSTEITAVSPPGSGTVDVTVTTPAGTSVATATDSFRYVNAAALSVGSAGGVLATTDGAFSLTVPPGALAAGASLSLAESCAPPAGLPAGMKAASCVFTLSGASLGQSQAATIAYDSAALGGLSPDRLSVYMEGIHGWTFAPTAVDAAKGTVSVQVPGPATLVVLAATRTFPDVPQSYWASADIDALLAAGVVSGYPDGSFRPDAPLTRAQFVKMLADALGLQPDSAATRFTDVPAAAWFAPYVSAAVKAGLVDGTSATTFSPDATVTREQMAVLLARALHLSGTATLTFDDANAIHAWARSDVQAAVAAGYLNGFPDRSFRPQGATTRAQAAKVLAMAIAHLAS